VNLEFDFDHDIVTEFGVGRTTDDGEEFVSIPVDVQVQNALIDMVFATRDAMEEREEDVAEYEPSETCSGVRYVTLPLANDLADQIRLIHTAQNLAVQPDGLENPSNIFCYFVRISDNQQRHVTAVKRATQFKGVLKFRLVRFLNDEMKLVNEDMFKLDKDFDLLADQDTVHILHPGGFEAVGRLHNAILAAVPANIAAIEADLPFVDFTSISDYASGHSRAARSLAAIRSRGRSQGIDRAALCDMCAKTGVDVVVEGDKVAVAPSLVVAFLEVLDRRRYEVLLVADAPEPYRATNRRRL
jgi:hypothetical protein